MFSGKTSLEEKELPKNLFEDDPEPTRPITKPVTSAKTVAKVVVSKKVDADDDPLGALGPKAPVKTEPSKEELEKSAQEKAHREKIAKERAAREQNAKEQAARQQAAKEAKDRAAKEQLAKEKKEQEAAAKAKEAAAKEAAKEAAAKEAAAKEAAAKEAAAKEAAAKEAAAKEAAAKEAAKEAAARDQPKKVNVNVSQKANHKARLTAFLAQYNPTKLPNVDKILEKYAGQEEEMFVKLYAAYGLKPPTLESLSGTKSPPTSPKTATSTSSTNTSAKPAPPAPSAPSTTVFIKSGPAASTTSSSEGPKEEEKIVVPEGPSIWDQADSWSSEEKTTAKKDASQEKIKEKAPEKTKEEAKRDLDQILGQKKKEEEEEEEYDPMKKAASVSIKTQPSAIFVPAAGAKPGGNCNRCKEELGAKVVKALGHTWHPECFVCFACHKTFPDGQYSVFEGEAFCNDVCVESQICDECQKLIRETEYLTVNKKKYHNACFKCQLCDNPFINGEFLMQDGVAICKSCASSSEGDIDLTGLTVSSTEGGIPEDMTLADGEEDTEII